MQTIGAAIFRDFSQLLLKYGASLEDIVGMVYTHEELDPSTGKYKKYFDLTTVKRNPKKYPDGYSYKVRYKLDLSGNKIVQGKATYTTKTASIDEAVKIGFDNRMDVLKNYELSKGKPKSGNVFYKMLNDYYAEGSKYLEDDNVNNKREIVHKSRIEAQTFIKSDLIPYLQENKIKHISEITTSVYSGFKIYLQAKGIKNKTINNRLNYFIRILEYHLRNGILAKLPFTKGTALLRLTGKQEKEDAEVLPIEKLKGIYPQKDYIDPLGIVNAMNMILSRPKVFYDTLNRKDRKAIFDDYTLPFTLGILALNTGMRNSEVARIKREDFIGVGEKKIFLLRIWNKKTEYFNKTNESKYRKIPLHDFTTRAVKIYIKRKEELYGEVKGADFLFGSAIIDKDSGDVDGFIHSRVFDKAVLLFLKLIKHKKDFREFFTDEKELIKTMGDIQSLQEELKEMKDAGKGISFYSFRKTFRTMLGLNNDLAEYYMGHKLGNDAKTTYIQVNSLKNETFVDEYAQPVISMLDKYVFLSDDEQDKLLEGYRDNAIDRNNFIKSRMEQGMSLEDAWGDYHREQKTMKENEETNLEKNGYFDRI